VRVLPTGLVDALTIEPVVHADERGFFVEVYRETVFAEQNLIREWVQDNHSRSRRGVLRGMHFQPGMAKLIRCARGTIVDVLVDLRRGSPSYGSWEAFELDDVAHRQVYCPDGFAHGFCVVSEVADVVYRCSTAYDPAAERGFHYADPEVGISWPATDYTVSARDSRAPQLAEIADALPFEYRR
jgi:dTDP-4-dehydrorhamnose 3,5-epimerase